MGERTMQWVPVTGVPGVRVDAEAGHSTTGLHNEKMFFFKVWALRCCLAMAVVIHGYQLCKYPRFLAGYTCTLL
jgi:hypothetical protein